MSRAIIILIAAGLTIAVAPARAQVTTGSESPMPTAETGPTIDLQVLLEQVAEKSGKKFLVEQRVPQTIHIGGIGVDDPTYATLLSILRNNGLAAAEVGGYVNVLPDAAIRQLPLRIVQHDDPDIPADEWVMRLITVPNGNAPFLVPILRPLIAQPGHLAAAAEPGPQNTGEKLLIVASYAKVKQITELVEMLGK